MKVRKETIKEVVIYLEKKGFAFGLGTPDEGIMQPMSGTELMLYLYRFDDWRRQDMHLTFGEYALWKQDSTRCMATTQKGERCKEKDFPYCRIHAYMGSKLSGKTAEQAARELGISKCSILNWCIKLGIHKRNSQGWYILEQSDIEMIRDRRNKNPRITSRLDDVIHEALIE